MNNRICLRVGGLMAVAVATAFSLIPGCNGSLFPSNGGANPFDQVLLADASARSVNGGFAEGGPVARLTQLLSLTADQQTQARDIFDRMRSALQPLHEQARTDIRNVLTADQQPELDALRAEHDGPGAGFMGGRGPGAMGPGPMGAGATGGQGIGPMGIHPPMMGAPGNMDAMRQMMLDHLAEMLGLSDDQKAAIKTIQDTLHTAVEARRQQAMDELRAILTPEQIVTLDQIQAERL